LVSLAGHDEDDAAGAGPLPEGLVEVTPWLTPPLTRRKPWFSVRMAAALRRRSPSWRRHPGNRRGVGFAAVFGGGRGDISCLASPSPMSSVKCLVWCLAAERPLLAGRRPRLGERGKGSPLRQQWRFGRCVYRLWWSCSATWGGGVPSVASSWVRLRPAASVRCCGGAYGGGGLGEAFWTLMVDSPPAA
jgi:hypothetical protein